MTDRWRETEKYPRFSSAMRKPVRGFAKLDKTDAHFEVRMLVSPFTEEEAAG